MVKFTHEIEREAVLIKKMIITFCWNVSAWLQDKQRSKLIFSEAKQTEKKMLDSHKRKWKESDGITSLEGHSTGSEDLTSGNRYPVVMLETPANQVSVLSNTGNTEIDDQVGQVVYKAINAAHRFSWDSF